MSLKLPPQGPPSQLPPPPPGKRPDAADSTKVSTTSETTVDENNKEERKTAEDTDTSSSTSGTGNTKLDNSSLQLSAKKVRAMMKLLQEGFTKTEIDQYFEWNEEKSAYELKSGTEVNGKTVSSKEELLAVLREETIDDNIDETFKIFAEDETEKTDETQGTQGSSDVEKTDDTAETEFPFDLTDKTLANAANGNFDFSVVPNYDQDFTSNFYTQPSMSQLGSATSKNTIDEGYWDKALDALAEMKPQLHAYIKTQMEEKGLTYNYETVDKYLDNMITESVQAALYTANFPTEQTVDNWDKCNQSTTNSTAYFKMSAVINTLIVFVDSELGNDSDYAGLLGSSSSRYRPEAFSEESYANRNGFSLLESSNLLNTADKFLTDDEKMLKTVLVGLQMDDSGYFGETTTSTTRTVSHILDLYADTMKSWLKAQYSNLDDTQIESILNETKQEIMDSDTLSSMEITEGHNQGKYNLEAIVTAYNEKVISAAESSGAEVNYHGSLLGGGGAMQSAMNNAIVNQAIKEKCPNADDDAVSGIRNILAYYDSRISRNDIAGILEKITDENGLKSGLTTGEIDELVEEFLSSKVEETIDFDTGALSELQNSVYQDYQEWLKKQSGGTD